MTRTALVALATLVLGCGSPTEPGPERSLGFIIGLSEDDPRIVVPDTVEAGEDFTVTVGTYGLDSCWEKAATEIEQVATAQRATIRPFDVDAQQPDTGCYMAIQEFTHTATLSFAQPGAAQVEVHGRDMDTDAERTFVLDVIVR